MASTVQVDVLGTIFSNFHIQSNASSMLSRVTHTACSCHTCISAAQRIRFTFAIKITCSFMTCISACRKVSNWVSDATSISRTMVIHLSSITPNTLRLKGYLMTIQLLNTNKMYSITKWQGYIRTYFGSR